MHHLLLLRACLKSQGAAQVSTLIGYGSPNLADTHDVHGAALGAKETEATRKNLKWEFGEFEVPPPVYDLFGASKKRGQAAQSAWNDAMASYAKQYPEARPCQKILGVWHTLWP